MTFREWLARHDPWGTSTRDVKATYSTKDMELCWYAARAAFASEIAASVATKSPAEAGLEEAAGPRGLTPR